MDREHTPTLVRGSLDGMLSAASIFRNKSLCPIGSSIATAAPMAPESLLRDPGAFLWFIRIQRARGVGIGRGGEWLCAMWSTGGGTRGFSSRPQTPTPFAVVAFARPSEDCPNLLDRVVRALPPNEPEKRAPRLKTLRQFEDSPVDWEHTPTLVRGSLGCMGNLDTFGFPGRLMIVLYSRIIG